MQCECRRWFCSKGRLTGSAQVQERRGGGGLWCCMLEVGQAEGVHVARTFSRQGDLKRYEQNKSVEEQCGLHGSSNSS